MEKIQVQLPFFLEETGAGYSTTFHHQIFTQLDGTVFPSVAKVWKGYATDHRCYQLIPRGTPYARIWAEGSANPNVGWSSGIQFFGGDGQGITEAEAVKLGANLEVLRQLLAEVEVWQNGRGCHWPVGFDRVQPADFGLLEMALNLQSPNEAAELVKAVWETFPAMAEWHAAVGQGQALTQRGLVVVPGLEGRWRYHQPPVRAGLWLRTLSSFAIAHHLLSFDPPIYCLAADVAQRHPPRAGFWKGIGWAPRLASVLVKDARDGGEVSGAVQGIFWIRHWPPEGGVD